MSHGIDRQLKDKTVSLSSWVTTHDSVRVVFDRFWPKLRLQSLTWCLVHLQAILGMIIRVVVNCIKK